MVRKLSLLVVAGLVATTLIPTPASATSAVPAGHQPPTVRCAFTPTDEPPAKPVTIPSSKARAKGTVDVYFLTNYGPFVVRMDRANAPCGVASFVHLTKSRFYDKTQCFRLTNSARLGVLQCGDIYRQEEGGPGYKFPDEVTGQETYPRGTVAMGNQGPGTNGSEFFVVHSFANIPPAYTVLGRVVFGMSAFDRMVKAGIADPDQDGPPVRPIRLLKVFTLG